MRRWLVLVLVLVLAGCAPEIAQTVDLTHANVRVPFQTDPARVLVFAGDVDQAYDVLSDLQVAVRQQGAFGEQPTRAGAIRALQEQAGRIGAHAIIMVWIGDKGMSFWSYNELRGQARAIRFR